MSKKLKWRRLLFTTLWLLAGGGFMVVVGTSAKMQYSRSLHPVPELRIDYHKGLYFVQETEIMEVVHNHLSDSLPGNKLSEVGIKLIEEDILAIPYVKSVDVYTGSNGKLLIDVAQREPVIRIINRSGVSYYLDNSGEIIPHTSNFTSRVPVATGYISDDGVYLGPAGHEHLKDLYYLVMALRKDSFFISLIDQIYRDESGEWVLIPKSERHRIIIGNTEELDDKLYRLKRFYRQGLKQSGWQAYKKIDLRFRDQIICQKP